MAPTELLIWLLVIVAGLTVLGLISYLIGRLVHTCRQGRTASGSLVKQSPVTVLKVRKLGSAEESDRELVLQLPDRMERTIVADAAWASRLEPGHRGTARWAGGRMVSFVHETKR